MDKKNTHQQASETGDSFLVDTLPRGAKNTWADFVIASPVPVNRSRVTRVVLAEDHPRVRAGLRYLLEQSSDIEVVGEAADGLQAIAMVEKQCPDILVLDMEMPHMDGVQVAARLKESNSPVQILVVSAHDDRQYILSMLKGGAAGYLMKEEVPDVLIKAVHGVARGERGWVSGNVARKIGDVNRVNSSERVTLTHREVDVLRMLKQKKGIAEIAEKMGITEKTVERHLELLYIKLKASSLQELRSRAAEAGIQ